MDEKICRLCLQTSKNHQTIEGSLLKLLQPLKLSLNLSKENVMCIECANYLQVFSNFKTASFYMRDRTLSLCNTENKSLKTEIKCSFCPKTGGEGSFVSLNETKKYDSLVVMLKLHILETNVNNTEELLSCEVCLDALQGVLSFISKCLEVEERISKYTEIEGTDDKGQIELKGVQEFTFKSAVKFEIESIDVKEFGLNQIKKEYTVAVESEVKYENDGDSPELILKSEDVDVKLEDFDVKLEDVDVKSEQVSCDSFQQPTDEYKIGGDPLEMVISETSQKDKKQHLYTHEISSAINMFKCETCSYTTKYPSYIKGQKDMEQHLLTHEPPSTIRMLKCEMCSYATNYTCNIKRHLVTHKSPSEINMLKCDVCSYRTKFKNYLKKHLMTHKSYTEVNTFQCEMCSYVSKDKSNLKKHLLIHKSPSEVNMYNCEICSYKTKYKRCLQGHLMTHKSPSERSMFKCAICSFESRHKRHLSKHLSIHKGLSEISVFKCAMCPYKTDHKSNLRRHLLAHESSSEINKFECAICSYKTQRKHRLKEHLLTHKSISKVDVQV